MERVLESVLTSRVSASGPRTPKSDSALRRRTAVQTDRYNVFRVNLSSQILSS
jgi:hypothetical protein